MVSIAFPEVPDSSKVVDLDFTSAKFRKKRAQIGG